MGKDTKNTGSIFKRGKAVADTARLGAMLCNIYDTVYELGLNDDTLYILSSANGVVEKTAIGTITGCLKSAKENVFYSQEDVEKFSDVMSLKKLNPIDRTELVEYVECRIKSMGGQYRWRSYLAHATNLDDTNKRSCILCVKDIQDSKHNEDNKNKQISEALVLAEVASRAKSELVARISHEIRTPLNAVLGYAGFLADEKLSSKGTDYLTKLDYSANHLLRIANEILDLPIIETGVTRANNTSFDLKEFVVTLSAIFYNQTQDKNQKFDITINNLTEEYIIGDQLKLNQILIKLLSNSIKFTPDGGKILLKITQTAIEDEVVKLRFEVTDTGIGMSDDFIERAFKPFEQDGPEIAKKYGGTGIGLSIAKELVDALDGTISITSKQDMGTTVTVDIPFLLDFNQMPDIKALQNFAELNLLIIDDEETSRDYLTLLFSNCGVNCSTAENGLTAINMAKEATLAGKPYHMVVLDWGITDIDPSDLVQAINASVLSKPTFVVTSYDFSKISGAVKKAGVKNFLSKPVFQSTATNLLMNLFGRERKTRMETRPTQFFSGQRLLLAEDNEMNAEIASELLSKAGLVVDVAVNGQDALLQFAASAPGTYSAILMDITMPVMDGYTATRQIRACKHSEAKSIPIIAMTADAFAEDVARALESGMNNHISKPIDVALLYNILVKYIK